MNKKVLIVGATELMSIVKVIDERDAWDYVELAVVPDEDYERALEIVENMLSAKQRLRKLSVLEELNEYLQTLKSVA